MSMPTQASGDAEKSADASVIATRSVAGSGGYDEVTKMFSITLQLFFHYNWLGYITFS